jgi:hypothetical protein
MFFISFRTVSNFANESFFHPFEHCLITIFYLSDCILLMMRLPSITVTGSLKNTFIYLHRIRAMRRNFTRVPHYDPVEENFTIFRCAMSKLCIKI